MLRRVVGTVRLLLLVFGAILLALIPFSWFYFAYLPYGVGPLTGYCEHSYLVVIWEHAPPPALPAPEGYEFSLIRRVPFSGPSLPLLPRINRDQRTFTVIGVPLWLLAAVCLAWPVTSLLVRRRRRGRGFEVEARGGGAVSTADS